MEVGNEDLCFAQFRHLVGREDIVVAIIILRVVRQKDAQPVADGDAGSNDEKHVRKACILGLAILFKACQAMSIAGDDEKGVAETGTPPRRGHGFRRQAISMAMTTVLPEPVAILMMRGRPGLDCRWPRAEHSRSRHRRIFVRPR